MGREKASEHVTVDKLAHPLCHFTCKETNPERGGHWSKVTQLVMAEPGLEPRPLSCQAFFSLSVTMLFGAWNCLFPTTQLPTTSLPCQTLPILIKARPPAPLP